MSMKVSMMGYDMHDGRIYMRVTSNTSPKAKLKVGTLIIISPKFLGDDDETTPAPLNMHETRFAVSAARVLNMGSSVEVVADRAAWVRSC